ncbi:MAG: SLBB domain-containing protein [Prevotella sp.]|nr:SLBB domain-containing protein [Prevotella sp.]
MRKFLLSLLFVMVASVAAMAQSNMTDAQIISFVQQELRAGTTQEQIVVKLMQIGVPVERLQELKKKYKDLGGSVLSENGVSGTGLGSSRMRSQDNALGGQTMPMVLPNGVVVGGQGMASGMGDMSGMYGMGDMYGGMYGQYSTLEDSLAMRRYMLSVLSQGGKKVFGRDIFNNSFLSFEPNVNIATPDDYILGPGDAVYIDIYGASQRTIEETVSPDGDVNIEGFGPVHVSGMTVAKAAQRVRSALSSYYADSQIRLTLGETRSIIVNVMGEVLLPGTYTLSPFSTVFQALYMAGGVNDIGTLRDIKVYRNNKLVTSVDIYDYILNGKLSGNIRLADNDVIVVGPYDCLVNISGKVKRPMYYEMRSDESLATLMKYAGGFTGDAYTGSVRVMRKSGNAYSVWNVAEFDMSSFRLCDEDSVSIDSVLPRYENMVELKGAAKRPGKYQLGGSITTVRDLLNASDGLKEEAFADHVVLHRRKADRSLEVLSFNLNAVLDGLDPDVTLQNEDVLFIPSKEEHNADLSLTIYGEVYYPGKYQYAEGMTVEDFILQAGGLKDGAMTQKVIVSRRVSTLDGASDDGRGTRAQTFEITLKDGFALDGNEGFRLEPFDEVYVSKLPGYGEQITMIVDGEVTMRGTHVLGTNNARLSDVVAQAGGLTKDAWAKGAHIIRKMDIDERRHREDLMRLGPKDNNEVFLQNHVDSLIWDEFINANTYVVGIYLDKALADPGGMYDITLRDGDILVVPQYDSTVRISGEVNYPCSATFLSGKSAKHYIKAAGGYSSNAWRNHAYVLYANGTVERGGDVEPGCEVIVPVRPAKPISNIATWLSGISSLGTVAALIITALN